MQHRTKSGKLTEVWNLKTSKPSHSTNPKQIIQHYMSDILTPILNSDTQVRSVVPLFNAKVNALPPLLSKN